MRPLLAAATLLSAHNVEAGRLEGGNFTTINTTGPSKASTPVTFQNAFDTVPVVVAISDQRGGQSASIRISGVTTTGFDALVLEPDDWDGGHLDQMIQYIAIEPGRHVLPGGNIIEAGRTNISNIQRGAGVPGTASWANVNYSASLGPAVAVLHQIQTANSESALPPATVSRPHITSIIDNATSTGFQIALDRSQALTGPAPVSETVGWIAVTAGLNGSFPDISANTISWASRLSGFVVRGWGDDCFTQSFGLNSASAVVVAKKNSRRNSDGGWLRYCSKSATTLGLRVDEDTDQDSERSVAAADAERSGFLAFSQSFHANLRPEISVTKVSQNFVSDMGNQFALPGAVYEYLILVTNSGNAPPNADSVIITELLPSEIEMRVTDYGAPGSGPVVFSDGAPASALNYSFNSLGSSSDSISFSTDGTNFNYTPVPDGDGYDSNVTHVRIRPSGFFAPNSGSGSPNFSLRFRARIK